MNCQQHTDQTNCPCDRRIHPPELKIPAGLSRLPRQLATFPEFRNAMLAAIRTKYPLYHWRARKEDDFGVMLLEMWAYICDSLSFYDQVIAQEVYLRTAQERSSLSKLIQLLGYIPRPAVAATVWLAAVAEGRRPVQLPKGLAFRSGAFGEEPPQVFELDADTTIHPFTNKWNIQPPRPAFVQTNKPSGFFVLPNLEIAEDDVLFLLHTHSADRSQGLTVQEVSTETGIDQQTYTQVTFDQATKILKGTPLSRLRLYAPRQTTALWTIVRLDQDNKVINPSVVTKGGKTSLTLSKVYDQIKAEQHVLVSRQGEYRAFRIAKVSQLMREPNPVSSATINGFSYDIPSISVPVTEIQLDTDINDAGRKAPTNSTGDWTDSHRSELVVHFEMETAGRVVNLPKTHLASQDPIILEPPPDTSLNENAIRSFLLEDFSLESAQVEGRLDTGDRRLILNQGQGWSPALRLPVTAYGNPLPASRGETVREEILGTGDASKANQRFKLQKKPLTYLLAPSSDSGVTNTLKVYVDGIRWQEVSSFFGAGSEDEIYIVRQDEAGDSHLTFGDGVRGRRLPTGSQVMATYRFGAGAATPPSGSINQIAKPFEGLQSIVNPIAASGGADAESSDELRTYAPASALVLGRAVSIPDMEAAALSLPGVRRVQAEWRWDGRKQRPVVAIWYIGEQNLETLVSQRLRSLCDPNTPFQVTQAKAIQVNLSISIQLNERYLPEEVLGEVRRLLIEQAGGLLRPENQQIGFPFYRSRLFEAVLAVPGTVAVTGVFWNQSVFRQFARRPPAGQYFDFEKGILSITHTQADPS